MEIALVRSLSSLWIKTIVYAKQYFDVCIKEWKFNIDESLKKGFYILFIWRGGGAGHPLHEGRGVHSYPVGLWPGHNVTRLRRRRRPVTTPDCLCYLKQEYYKSFPWIWKGVSATLQSGRYTLSYPRGLCRVVSENDFFLKHKITCQTW